jgi:hypothetical protein
VARAGVFVDVNRDFLSWSLREHLWLRNVFNIDRGSFRLKSS